ncbi:MAG: pre-peptidase C-terminal domain-containing protein [Treponema sp.]|nr:pre-peptidase C-terminal domain-containing protein [Treponema sp.]
MKKIIFGFALALLCGVCFAQQKAVAVAAFGNKRGISAESAQTITNLVIGRLSVNGIVRVVDRASFDKILEEMKFQASDWADKERTAALGEATNADFVIRGEIDTMDGLIIITARMIDIRTAQVVAYSDVELTRMNEARAKMPEFVETLVQSLSGNTRTAALEVPVVIQGQGTSASPITAAPNGPWIARNLRSDHGEDWFRVTAPAEALLVMETSGDIDTYMELFDSSLSLLDENDDGGEGRNAKAAYYFERGQTCLVKVRGYSSDVTGPFQFHVVTGTDTAEPNNSMTAATAISLGTAVSATIAPSGDTDWYRAVIPPGGREFAAYTEGGMDTKLYLYDSRGTLLAEDDDNGPGPNACIQMVVNPGTVYLRVEHYDNSGVGQYVLNANMQDAVPPDRFENDDTQSAAKDIQVGSSQNRTFTNAADYDWARLRITQAGYYDIRAAVSGSLDSYLGLFDRNGNSITENDSGGDGEDDAIVIWLNPETYFIRVHCYSSGPLGNRRQYTLGVNATREPIPPDPFENDDTRSEASYISGSQIRTFTNDADIDWARFEVGEAGTYDIRSAAAVKSLDTYLRLYDSNGTLIAEDDDSGGGYDAHINIRLNSGTYYIQASTLDSDLANRRQYTLSVSRR